MSNAYSDRVLALAGMIQSLAQVRRIADTGQADSAAEHAVLDSVFRIDAVDAQAVYGSERAVAAGLRTLGMHLDKQQPDPALFKLATSVLQLERRFVAEKQVVRAVGDGIARIAALRHEDSAHPEVLSALGGLYAQTLSQLRPKVMVQGNPHYLAQPAVVAEIRALLLASVRSAVLWRQVGGSYWDFLLSRKPMRAAVDDWLRG